MMIGVPLLQLILFGYASNTDPKRLPSALLVADQGVFARSLVRALENSGYFEVSRQAASEAEADKLLARGEVQFVMSIPEDFSRELLRGQRPAVLVEADATDPVATANAPQPKLDRPSDPRGPTEREAVAFRGRFPAASRSPDRPPHPRTRRPPGPPAAAADA